MSPRCVILVPRRLKYRHFLTVVLLFVCVFYIYQNNLARVEQDLATMIIRRIRELRNGGRSHQEQEQQHQQQRERREAIHTPALPESSLRIVVMDNEFFGDEGGGEDELEEAKEAKEAEEEYNVPEENKNSEEPDIAEQEWRQAESKTVVQKNDELPEFDGYYSVNESISGTAVTKVLLLAYQRSGSSLVGELLTSPQHAVYLYEPLFLFRDTSSYGGPDGLAMRGVTRVLGDILDCNPKVLPRYDGRRFMMRGAPLDTCSSNPFRLAKVIRARAATLRPWVLHRGDIKVVHLVRDPRAVRCSLQSTWWIWSPTSMDSAILCQRMRDDMQLGEELGGNRYILVRYEDLMTNAVNTTKRILQFLGQEYNSSVQQYLESHIGRNETHTTGKKRRLRPFKTRRDATYDPDHWRTKLSSDRILKTETDCEEVLRKLNYTTIP